MKSKSWLAKVSIATIAAIAWGGSLPEGSLPEVRADPCGMVPPIYSGDGPPIIRIGEQQTYVFFKEGVETFVIRPGISGKVDEFGMLIPFPTPPAIRKVPDTIFSHIAAAVDPPEVVLHLYTEVEEAGAFADDSDANGLQFAARGIAKDEVRVLRREAVGMYEVAVLEAGSAAALKKWMDNHGFRYPDGMDEVCEDYVDSKWCFVAVKTAVGQKAGVDPRPGQREVNAQLPDGSTFDGFVQAMGFRFKTDELVVPMRLSAFNDGELRNVLYLLTDGPKRIRSIPEEYVVRQVAGDQLFRNVTDLLPLRLIGGTEKDLQQWHHQQLAVQRDPETKNGEAKRLFAADLLAVHSGQLSLPHEEQEKELLAIGEGLGLRGPEIDGLNAQELKANTDKAVQQALAKVKQMTLTVVDGDFPREVLASQNLKFAEYRMPRRRNNSRAYDANTKEPGQAKAGILKLGALDPASIKDPLSDPETTRGWATLAFSLVALGSLLIGIVLSPSLTQTPKIRLPTL